MFTKSVTPLCLAFYQNGGSAGGHHQHAAVAAYGFIVEVDTYHSIGSHATGFLFHLAQSGALGFAQDLFVRTGASADKVAHAGKNIAKEIGSNDGFARHNAVVLDNAMSFDVGCGCCKHNALVYFISD